jgi:hypothetical protein
MVAFTLKTVCIARDKYRLLSGYISLSFHVYLVSLFLSLSYDLPAHKRRATALHCPFSAASSSLNQCVSYDV